MFKAVRSRLPGDLFPGGAKANWWAKTVQLDLEAKRVVARENTSLDVGIGPEKPGAARGVRSWRGTWGSLA